MKKKGFNKFVLLLLLTINNIFPFDKVAIIILDLLYYPKLKFLSSRLKLVIFLIFLSLSISYTLNLGTASLRIFYPFLFFLGAIFLSYEEIDLKKISYLFLPNIIVGILGVIYCLASNLEPNNFVVMSWGKSIIFPICATGFSPTPQVYGTFCILYIWGCLDKNQVDFGFVLSVVGILLSQNRTSYIFLLLILLLYKGNWVVFLGFILFVILLNNKEVFIDIGNSQNLDSRVLLRHGFELQFWNSNNLSTYLTGIGNNQIAPQYSRYNLDSRPYIENGLDFILAISGFNGLILLSIILLFYLIDLLKKRKIRICIIFMFYMMVNQWLTQEFLASSFFFFILFVLILSEQKNNIVTN